MAAAAPPAPRSRGPAGEAALCGGVSSGPAPLPPTLEEKGTPARRRSLTCAGQAHGSAAPLRGLGARGVTAAQQNALGRAGTAAPRP